MFGAFARSSSSGIAFRAWQKLARLAGADHLHTNGISNKFYETDDEVLDSIAAVRGPCWAQPTCPCCRPGQWAGLAPATYAAVGTTDLLVLAGGGIHGHPDGAAPASRACATPGRRQERGETLEGRIKSSLAPSQCGGGVRGRAVSELRAPSTATTSPAASTRCCNSRAAGWRGAYSSVCRIAASLRAADGVDVIGIAGIARSLPTARDGGRARARFSRRSPHWTRRSFSTKRAPPPTPHPRRQPRPVIEVGRGCSASPDPGALRTARFRPLHHLRPPLRGRGGTVYRLDRQPTMSNHPATPMNESDLALTSRTDAPRHRDVPLWRQRRLSALLREHRGSTRARRAQRRPPVDLGAAVCRTARAGFAIGSGGLSAGIAAAGPGDEPAPRPPTPRRPRACGVGQPVHPDGRQEDAGAAAG